MRRVRTFLVLLVFASSLFPSTQLLGQIDKIVIAAGTDEDRDLQAISSETDPQKKLAMYQDFVKKFAANPAAVAYGNWQISQAYQNSGDLSKALEYGDKALTGSPRNLDILVSQASLAQQAKDNGKLIDYSCRGGEVCSSIGKNKPAGVSDEEFSRQAVEDKAASKNNCDFLESVGFNVIASENDPKSRMEEIEKYTAAFPGSKFQDQVSSYAMYTLGPGQLNDPERLVAFGEKTLAANPDSLPALLLLASYYSDSPKPGSVTKAITYAQKALEVAKPDAPDADRPRKLSAGVAHSTLGYAYMKQDRTLAAIPELKAAAALLKGEDDQPYAVALYRLGFAYAKLDRTTEAREVLTEAVKIPGPLQKMSQELLTKVNAARAKGK
ncbi:MAG TPA: tetratricopeptide repeat protein [Candidatus Aquilonibacter sp.]|nr:tetratricopeptide repeat protein [Candidatus Aquilonibacter sp.]